MWLAFPFHPQIFRVSHRGVGLFIPDCWLITIPSTPESGEAETTHYSGEPDVISK